MILKLVVDDSGVRQTIKFTLVESRCPRIVIETRDDPWQVGLCKPFKDGHTDDSRLLRSGNPSPNSVEHSRLPDGFPFWHECVPFDPGMDRDFEFLVVRSVCNHLCILPCGLPPAKSGNQQRW